MAIAVTMMAIAVTMMAMVTIVTMMIVMTIVTMVIVMTKDFAPVTTSPLRRLRYSDDCATVTNVAAAAP